MDAQQNSSIGNIFKNGCTLQQCRKHFNFKRYFLDKYLFELFVTIPCYPFPPPNSKTENGFPTHLTTAVFPSLHLSRHHRSSPSSNLNRNPYFFNSTAPATNMRTSLPPFPIVRFILSTPNCPLFAHEFLLYFLKF